MYATDANYLTTKQLVEKYDWLTMRRLRTLLSEREENGLSQYVRFLTKGLLLIDESGFLEWIDGRVSSLGSNQ